MNKQELVDAVAGKLGPDASKKQVEETLKTILEEIALTMRKGESVQLVGFGTFEPRRRGARTARNPQTGEAIRVKAATVPAFKASGSLKNIVGRKAGAKKASAKKATKKKSAKKAGAKKTGAKKATAKKAAKKSTRKSAKKSARKR